MKTETTEAEALRVAKAIWDWSCWAFSTGPSAPDWSDDPNWLHRAEAIKLGRAAIEAMP